MKYVVYFDDGTMLGNQPTLTTHARYVREFSNAFVFTNKRKAESAASWANKPSTVEAIQS